MSPSNFDTFPMHRRTIEFFSDAQKNHRMYSFHWKRETFEEEGDVFQCTHNEGSSCSNHDIRAKQLAFLSFSVDVEKQITSSRITVLSGSVVDKLTADSRITVSSQSVFKKRVIDGADALSLTPGEGSSPSGNRTHFKETETTASGGSGGLSEEEKGKGKEPEHPPKTPPFYPTTHSSSSSSFSPAQDSQGNGKAQG